MGKASTARPAESRLGQLVVERGLLTREELEQVVESMKARESQARGAARRGPQLLGETLVEARYLTADLLSELLGEQADRRNEPHASARRSAKVERDGGLAPLVATARAERAHELVFVAGQSPALRAAAGLVPLEHPVCSAEDVKAFADEAFGADVRAALEATGGSTTRLLDLPDGRSRATLTICERGVDLTVRILERPLAADAPLPDGVAQLADRRRGLVLVAGLDASVRDYVLGKLVDRMNDTSKRHVITIERTPSYRHPSKKSLIAQREVGAHTPSFDAALRAALREDPDVLVVGDMSDREAITTALLAAETGHLVLAALHAADAPAALERLVDVLPEAQRGLVRATLADTIQAVAVVDSVPAKGGEHFIVADLVTASPLLSRLIREGRLHQLQSVTSGVVSRDDRLVELYQEGRLSRAVVLERLTDASRLRSV